jgi:hypothetical protein
MENKPFKERREFSIKKLQKSLNDLGDKIRRETFALNQPITIAEGDYVIRLHKDGTKEILTQVEIVKTNRTFKGRKYSFPAQ